MSWRTTLLVHVGWSENERNIAELRRAVAQHDRGELRDLGEATRPWAENALRGVRVWGGAFKHFDFGAFMHAVVRIPWAEPDRVQVFVHF